ASTFTARVITSTLSDLHSAVTGAIGALKGSLHGGANEAVMHTFDELGIRPEEAEAEAKARATAWMEDALAQKKKVMGFGHRDYTAGPTYHLMGFDTELFTPLFIAARVTGWTAHVMEQRAANALIRPLSEYSGPDERPVPGT